jgi:2-methylaconitate cis-trans-isomerase PrpF
VYDQYGIPAALVRGGTSKGVFLHARDLPENRQERDQVILSIFGSPDPRQIDGLGGADPLTSKVAIIAPSARADADVDYTFGYVGIEKGEVDYVGNCGNISQAVGPFAVDEGLIPAREPVTAVRIFNTNTGKLMVAEVPVSGGRAATEGDFAIHGVPGTGARLLLDFIDAAGSKTGRLLPTGNVVDRLILSDGRSVRVSLVDAANPGVFVQARDLDLGGTELPDETERDPRILALMNEVRVRGALMMKLADDAEHVSPAVPKVAIVSSPTDYRTRTGGTVRADEYDLLARTMALSVMHKAFAVTGGLCLSAAARIEGTVVYEVTRPATSPDAAVRIGHPSGVSHYQVAVERTPGGFELKKAAVAGTARRIMDGHVYVPRRIVPADTNT